MKPATFLKVSSIAVLSFLASATAHAAISKNTVDFIQNAVIANKFEIDTSERALQKSKNAAIRSFGRRMLDDHRRAGEKLRNVLRQEELAGLMTMTVDIKHQRIEDRLTLDSSDKFDKEYLNAQIDAHKDAVSLFQQYSRDGDDPALQNLAARLLPTLQHHQQMARDLRKNYKKSYMAGISEGINSNILEPAAGGGMIGPNRYNSILPP